MEDTAMRIESGSQTAMVFGVQPVMRNSEVEKSRQTSSAQGVTSPFHVQLSDLMAKVADVKASSGDVRWEKVRDIKEQLAEGSYNISGQDVAGKMLTLLQE